MMISLIIAGWTLDLPDSIPSHVHDKENFREINDKNRNQDNEKTDTLIDEDKYRNNKNDDNNTDFDNNKKNDIILGIGKIAKANIRDKEKGNGEAVEEEKVDIAIRQKILCPSSSSSLLSSSSSSS